MSLGDPLSHAPFKPRFLHCHFLNRDEQPTHTPTNTMKEKPYLTKSNYHQKIQKWMELLKQYNIHWKKPILEKSALLVIDMQNYFTDEKCHAYVPSSPFLINIINEIIEIFRAKKHPIIFTYFAVKRNESDPIKKWWGDTVYNNSYESKISPLLKIHPDDIILRKPTYDAFFKTNLEEFLSRANVENIYITGVLTNVCCETTIRSAFVRNFNVFVFIDGTATYSEKMHINSLINIVYAFATPLSYLSLK